MALRESRLVLARKGLPVKLGSEGVNGYDGELDLVTKFFPRIAVFERDDGQGVIGVWRENILTDYERVYLEFTGVNNDGGEIAAEISWDHGKGQISCDSMASGQSVLVLIDKSGVLIRSEEGKDGGSDYEQARGFIEKALEELLSSRRVLMKAYIWREDGFWIYRSEKNGSVPLDARPPESFLK